MDHPLNRPPHHPVKRRRRCVLSVPADSDRKIAKALQSGVDFIFLDLEDAVAPPAKPQARQNCVKAFNEASWGDTVRCFRMNGLDSHHAIEDLMYVVARAGANIDTVLIPKVKFARDVHFVDTFLGLLEAEHGIGKKIGLELLIEEVEGIQNIKEISHASERVESLMFGIGDYTRAQGVDIRDAMGKPRHYPGDVWHYQRSTLAVAANVLGIDYVDGPWGRIADAEGYRRECRLAKTLGGVGKWAIHPSQIAIAQEEFSPSASELKMAFIMRNTYLQAKERGEGAAKMSSGVMVDEAVMPMVNGIIEKAQFYGIDTEPFENLQDG